VLATGYNVVDVVAAKEKGVTVTNIPTYGTNAVGKFAIKDIYDIQVILDGAFEVIVKNFNGIAHFEGFQIFFDAVIQNSIPPPKSAAQIVMKTGREPRAVVKLA